MSRHSRDYLVTAWTSWNVTLQTMKNNLSKFSGPKLQFPIYDDGPLENKILYFLPYKSNFNINLSFFPIEYKAIVQYYLRPKKFISVSQAHFCNK